MKKMMMKEMDLDPTFFTLEPEQFDAIVAMLNNPPPPNEKLKALFAQKAPWESECASAVTCES